MRRRLILHCSSLKIFYVLLYRRSSILQDIYFFIVFDDLFLNWLPSVHKYTKLKGVDSKKITSLLPESKNVMSMARHFKTHLHKMKVYNTRPEKKHSHLHHTPPPPSAAFGAHTRQKKRNTWVWLLKQSRLTTKNGKVDILPVTLWPLMSHPYLLQAK